MARQVLFTFLGSRTHNLEPLLDYPVGDSHCFRPSAAMLTLSENAAPADTPPLYDHKVFDAAIRAGHGNFKFTADNEVLFFGDELTKDGYVHLFSKFLQCESYTL